VVGKLRGRAQRVERNVSGNSELPNGKEDGTHN
jgi:hypothetical protein